MQKYFKVPCDAFDYGLTPTQMTVYVYLLKRRGNKTSQAWPSVATIACDCGIGTTTARNAIKALCGKKLITKTEQYLPATKGRQRQSSNLYTIQISKSDEEYHKICSTPPQNPEGSTSKSVGEINRTISNRTTLIESSSSNCESEEDEDFKEILDSCYFHPDRDSRYPSPEIKRLARQAMEKLWNSNQVTVDGICYGRTEIRDLLFSHMSPDNLDHAIGQFMKAESVNCPVPYLCTCIIASVVNMDAIVSREIYKQYGT